MDNALPMTLATVCGSSPEPDRQNSDGSSGSGTFGDRAVSRQRHTAGVFTGTGKDTGKDTGIDTGIDTGKKRAGNGGHASRSRTLRSRLIEVVELLCCYPRMAQPDVSPLLAAMPLGGAVPLRSRPIPEGATGSHTNLRVPLRPGGRQIKPPAPSCMEPQLEAYVLMRGDHLSEEARRVSCDIRMGESLVILARSLAAYEIDIERAEELLVAEELSAGRQRELSELTRSNNHNAEAYGAWLEDILEGLPTPAEETRAAQCHLLLKALRIRLDSAILGWRNLESRYGLTRDS